MKVTVKQIDRAFTCEVSDFGNIDLQLEVYDDDEQLVQPLISSDDAYVVGLAIALK
jgi:hypothetical protein